MSRLRKPVIFETAFGLYTVDELIGEGGAGRVLGGVGPDDTKVALKVLAEERASTEKRRRFKNEIAFLSRNRHPNIVPVIDHGVSRGHEITGPFYVMQRYGGSLRDVMQAGLAPDRVLPLFSQILDGVEAATLAAGGPPRLEAREYSLRPW
jgi:serine/threonine protein kinase